VQPIRPPEQRQATLESWKEIASYFGVTVRTVQMWEESRGLPVKRLFGPRGRVRAEVEELEAWKLQVETGGRLPESPAKPGARRGFAIGLIAVVVLGIAGWAMLPRAGEPARYESKGAVLIVYDSHDREAWRYPFPSPPEPEEARRKASVSLPRFVDTDGDGQQELIFPAGVDLGTSASDTVYCFDRRGNLQWKFQPGRIVRSRKDIFRNVYVSDWLIPLPAPDGPGAELLIGSHQTPDYPSQVAALDRNGNVVRDYWHSGHLRTATLGDLEKDGRAKLYLAGVGNGELRTEIVVLNARAFSGASKERAQKCQLLDLGPPQEIARAALPNSLLSSVFLAYRLPGTLYLFAEELSVRTIETPEGSGALVEYCFGPRLIFRSAEPGDTALPAYRRLIAERRLPADAWARDPIRRSNF
jgi:hypothetical protein